MYIACMKQEVRINHLCTCTVCTYMPHILIIPLIINEYVHVHMYMHIRPKLKYVSGPPAWCQVITYRQTKK